MPIICGRQIVLVVLLLATAACNGGGSNRTPPTASGGSTGNPTSWQEGVFEPPENFEDQCASPRSGTNPDTGRAYADVQGSVLSENNWLRSWSHYLYLWYGEILDRDPANYNSTEEYFDVLKTFEQTASGNPKDKFHFDLPTSQWRALSQSGVSAGYGVTWAVISSLPPRQVVAAYTEPDTPATTAPANLARGATVLTIDGVDLVNAASQASVDTLNAGLFPSDSGEVHEFTIQDQGASSPRTITLVSTEVTSVPVQHVGTIDTTNGLVGYMSFNDHIATSEQQLIEAIAQLSDAGVVDLVLDIRYNGGGYLDIANELAFMIAGVNATAGRVFEELQFNDQHPLFNPVTGALLEPDLFRTTAVGFSAPQGQPLPSLGLTRVFVLTGPGTCSASEAIINGLRGIDVEVIQIGSTTCGKPYGFYPADNCGTTYFSIQFRGINDKGYGDYTDGFSPANVAATEGTPIPGCSVADDFTHQLGDPQEARFATALKYQIDETCPTPTGFASERAALSRAPRPLSATEGEVRKSVWLTNRILRP